MAERVIIELNEAHTGKLTGMHDIYIPANPPYRKEIPVYRVNDRTGHISVKIDPQKDYGGGTHKCPRPHRGLYTAK